MNPFNIIHPISIEIPSKILDQKILHEGRKRIGLIYGYPRRKVASWLIQTVTVFCVGLILFSNTYVSNYTFTNTEVESFKSSPIETYSNFNLDLTQDKHLIESDLTLLLSKDLNEI